MKQLVTLLTILLSFPLMSLAGLLAEWRMDGCVWNGTSGEVVDSSGHGNHATAKRVHTDGNGRICRSVDYLRFNRNHYIRTDRKVLRYGAKSVTVMGWIKVHRGGGKWISVWKLSPDDTDNSGNSRQPALGLYLQDARTVRFDMRNDGVRYRSLGKVTRSRIGYETWHHVAQVVERRRMYLYIDGNLAETFEAREDFRFNDGYFYIGDRWYEKSVRIDEVKIFSEALDRERVRKIYENEKLGKNHDGTERVCFSCDCGLPGDCREVFSEDFHEGLESGWRIVKLGAASCGWRVVKGTLEERSDACHAFMAKKLSKENADISTLTDYALKARVFPNGGATYNNGIGFVFGYRDAGNYFLVRWSDYSTSYSKWHNHKDFELWKVSDGVFSLLDERKHVDLPDSFELLLEVDRIHGIVVRVCGTDVKVNALKEHPSLGVFGLYTHDNDRGVRYDDVKLYRCGNLVAEWRMDECGWRGDRGEIADRTGKFDATAKGGADTAASRREGGGLCRVGRFENPHNLDRKYAEVADDDALSPHVGRRGEMTIMTWIKAFSYPTSDRQGRVPIVAKGESGNWEYALYLYHRRGVGFSVWNLNGRGYGEPVGGRLPLNEWHHLAGVVKKGKYVRIYLDGILVGQRTRLRGDTGNGRSKLYFARRGNGNHFFDGDMDEVKIYAKALKTSEILEIYHRERAGRDWDGGKRHCLECEDSSSSIPVGEFNAVDRVLSSCDVSTHWNRNITTKIAGLESGLTILARDKETKMPLRAKIDRIDLLFFAKGDTKRCRELPYARIPLCENGCGETDVAGCLDVSIPSSLLMRAARCVTVHIEGQVPGTSRERRPVESNATDDFSIRPRMFRFLNPVAEANLTSERLYRYPRGVVAVAFDGVTPVTDYNGSVRLDHSLHMRNGERNDSLSGAVKGDVSRFENGIADLELAFDDVAVVSLELNDTLWSNVDVDDTPEADRTVYGERNVTFIPHHFEVKFISSPTMEDNDTMNAFTYLSEDLNMSGWLRGLTLKITAQGEKGGTMRNFSNPMGRFFADPVDVTPMLSLPSRHSSPRISKRPESRYGVDLGFESGEAVLTYSDVAFNYERRYDTPIAPFRVKGEEGNISVSVQDATHSSVVGGVESEFEGSATFYYGRIRAEDIRTSERNVENPIELEVYDDNASVLVAGFRRNSLHWYRNERHRSRMNGGVLDAEANEEVTLPGSPDREIVFGLDRYGKGILSMEINTTTERPRRRTVHLKIDRWLWHVPKGFGESYSYDVSSDCTRHPCFEYTYLGAGTGRGVRSGEIEGSDFDVEVLDANATYERRRGVKLFR